MRETTLERMTSDPGGLERIWTWLIGDWPTYAERSTDLKRKPANARTNASGLVGWEQVWEGWTEDQRQTFAHLCGKTQTHLGYPCRRLGGSTGSDACSAAAPARAVPRIKWTKNRGPVTTN
jgi:hypothetical protein